MTLISLEHIMELNAVMYPFTVEPMMNDSRLTPATYMNLIKTLKLPYEVMQKEIYDHDTEKHFNPAVKYFQEYDREYFKKVATVILQDGSTEEKKVDYLAFELSSFMVSLGMKGYTVTQFKDNVFFEEYNFYRLMRMMMGDTEVGRNVIAKRLGNNLKNLDLKIDNLNTCIVEFFKDEVA